MTNEWIVAIMVALITTAGTIIGNVYLNRGNVNKAKVENIPDIYDQAQKMMDTNIELNTQLNQRNAESIELKNTIEQLNHTVEQLQKQVAKLQTELNKRETT